MATGKSYEILVSNEDTRDQVVRLLDEKYHHPNVTIMAFADHKPVDRYMHACTGSSQINVLHTMIWIMEAPRHIDDKVFFKELGYVVHTQEGEIDLKVPVNFELKPDQMQTVVSESSIEYHIGRFTAIQLNMPPLSEIKIELFTNPKLWKSHRNRTLNY